MHDKSHRPAAPAVNPVHLLDGRLRATGHGGLRFNNPFVVRVMRHAGGAYFDNLPVNFDKTGAELAERGRGLRAPPATERCNGKGGAEGHAGPVVFADFGYGLITERVMSALPSRVQ